MFKETHHDETSIMSTKPGAAFHISTDASEVAIGIFLIQEEEKNHILYIILAKILLL